jgi:hypothetical protein
LPFKAAARAGRDPGIIVGMAGPELTKTVEGMALRCLLVGLDDAQASICAASLMPIQMVRVGEPKEACSRISTVLPIMVVATRKLGEASLAELREFAETCACEVYVMDDPPPSDVTERLHEVLRRADKRRASRDRRDD